jgi:hypothetical protein
MKAIGQNPSDARDMARFMGLITKANPRTDAEWEEFNAIWEDVCNSHGCETLAINRFALIAAWDEIEPDYR